MPSNHSASTTDSHSPVFYGWTIVGMAFIALGISNGVTHNLYSVMVQPLGETFNASRATVMAATASAAFLGSSILSPFIGFMLQRQSIRVWMLIGGGALVVGYSLLSQVTALWQISLIYFVCWSLGATALGALSSNTLVSNWFVAKRGRALGLAAVGMSVGAFIFPPLVTWLIEQLGWRETCLLIAVTVLLFLPLFSRFVVDHPKLRGDFPDGIKIEDERSETQIKSTLTVAMMLKNRNFWLITSCVGIAFGCFNALTLNIIPLATDLGVTRQTASFLLSITAVCSMAGKIVVGTASDRLGPRISLFVPLSCICIGCFFLIGAHHFDSLVVGMVFIGLAAGGVIPVWSMLIGRFFGQQSFSLVMGVMNPLLMPFVIFSGPFAGWSNDVTGNYDQALYVFIGATVLALILSIFLRDDVVHDSL